MAGTSVAYSLRYITEAKHGPQKQIVESEQALEPI